MDVFLYAVGVACCLRAGWLSADGDWPMAILAFVAGMSLVIGHGP